jgi:hypothetical protein
VTPTPVFVIGIARSGTNLIARILSGHPQIRVALDPVLPVFRALRNALISRMAATNARARFRNDSAFQDYYFDVDGPILLDTILGGSADVGISPAELNGLRAAVVRRASVESAPLGQRLMAIDGSSYTELIASSFGIIAGGGPEVSHVAIKEVWISEFIPLLAAAFPTAFFYVIERDPRAIVASLLAMAARDSTQAAHVPSYARHWRKSIALGRRFAEDPAIRDRLRVVSYETLAENPEPAARAICKDLDLEFHPGMLDLSVNGWTGNSSFDGVGRGVYSSSVVRWRDELPTGVTAAIEVLCGPEMTLTAYRPSGRRAPDGVTFDYLQSAGASPGSWRSDGEDPMTDFGGELMRSFLLTHSVAADLQTVRRCFLFQETMTAIRRALPSTHQAFTTSV